ncbi:thioesterase II family protein [Sphaerisporangium corydalis]|uniref:Thioesterase II family protein n=1 Tax=Sphaerisporangium corydalis TaxID=1441875 RepID=A0ABV9EM99_9ACTN|nr:thioesterase domain-containing protein [Sphaerisporangium corydalis]
MTEYSRPPTLDSVPTLFCLPYAGGAASAYRAIRKTLAGVAEVVPLQLPGRESRFAEPPRVSVTEITDEIAPRTHRPYAVYGHSMGARIAFEVVRELRRRALPPPVRLYVGGAHPPDRKVPLAAAVDLPDDAFVDQLIRRAGAGTELRDVPELRELALPVLRSDFGWIKGYRFTPEPPLDVPVVAFAGLDDTEVPPPLMLGWGRHTRSRFHLGTVRGGHLFLADPHADLARLLAADLAGDGGPEPIEDDEAHLWLTTDAAGPAQPTGATQPAGIARRYGAGRPELRCAAACHDGLTLAAVTLGHAAGVAIGPPGAPDTTDDLLQAGEREQIEGMAEEDRPWLALRARTAKRALAEGTGVDPALIGFPDLAAPGPWRPLTGRDPGLGLDRWRVTHLSLPTPRGEVLAAVALPYDRPRLRLTRLTEASC